MTTTRITHATPAALYAHTQNRDWEADSNIPDIFRNKGCNDIAYQLVNNDAAQRTNVIIKFYLEHELKLTGKGQNYEFHNVENQKEHRKPCKPSQRRKGL